MRILGRLILMGILVSACGEGTSEPAELEPTCQFPGPPDTVFTLLPDSLHLVLGSADGAWLERTINGCDGVDRSIAEVTWAIRDTTIAKIASSRPEGFDVGYWYGVSSWTPPPLIEPRAPGRTFLVGEAPGWFDSLAVFVPDTVALGSIGLVATGEGSSCAVDQGAVAFCWGSAVGSLLGEPGVDPAVGTCWLGVPCSPMPVPRKANAASVHVGGGHACTLDPTGNASCWGRNTDWQVGTPTATDIVFEPVDVAGQTFTDLALGASHTCGITSTGDAYCWGDHSGGKLGDGNWRLNDAIAEPTLVSGNHDFLSLDAHRDFTCGATAAGHLYCWGWFRESGSRPVGSLPDCRLGSDEAGNVTLVPCAPQPLRMRLASGSGADSLFVQVSGKCALTTLGSVFCLELPESGPNTFNAFFVPKDGFGPFVSLSGGLNHTCGLTASGSAWCWGLNDVGALGDGTTQSRDVPVLVAGGHTFTQLAAGFEHTCGLTVEAAAWCWGSNGWGQVGTSILTEPLTPTRVRGQG